jgi:hypothetical protein
VREAERSKEPKDYWSIGGRNQRIIELVREAEDYWSPPDINDLGSF